MERCESAASLQRTLISTEWQDLVAQAPPHPAGILPGWRSDCHQLRALQQ
jgi:hypothetical protein